MTTKEIENQLRESAKPIDKHVKERRAAILARVFKRIEEESKNKKRYGGARHD